MYLAYVIFQWPLERVGAAFGRDRTTAGLACRQIEDLRDDPEFDAQLEQLEACLRLAPAEVMAAERLREDFERAGMLGRLTMDWEAGPRDRSPAGPAHLPSGGAARRRVQAALEEVGPGLREILEEV